MMNCPVCNAGQEWSPTCRRCRCDLSLLWQAHVACEAARRRALVALAQGRPADALRDARQAYDFDPSDRAARLLAVCHWLGGNVQQAWHLAVTLPPSDVERTATAIEPAAGALGVGVWLVREGWTWFYNPHDAASPCIVVEEDDLENAPSPPADAAPAAVHQE